MALSNLVVGVKIDKNSVKKATQDLKGELEGVGNDIEKNIGGKLSQIVGAFGVAKITQGFIALSKGAITLAGNLEQAKVAFTTMLGSGERASTLLKDLSAFAAKTPFELTGIRETAKQLLAFGVDASRMIPTLKALGDVSAGLSVPIQQVAYAYGQVKVAGQLLGNDLRQFTNAGVPLIEELSKNLGVAQDKIKGMVSDGLIKFGDVEKAFQTMSSEGGKFANMMDAQSKTLQGSWSNLQDSVAQLGEAFGGIFIPALTAVTQAITPMISAVTARVQENPKLAGAIGAITGGLVALLAIITGIGVVLPALTAGFGALGISVGAALGPLGAIIIALGLVTAIYPEYRQALGRLTEELMGTSVETQVLNKIIKEHHETIKDLTKQLGELDAQYRTGAISKESYDKQSKSLNNQLKAEQMTLKQLDSSYTDYTIAQNTATEAKDRLHNMKVNPGATVSAIRAEANAAIEATKAFMMASQAKAKLLAGQAGIKNYDPSKPNAIYEVDKSQVGMLSSYVATQKLATETSIQAGLEADLAQFNDDIKNAQKIVDGIKGGGSGGGGKGGAKKEVEEIENALDKVKDKYKDLGDKQKDLKDKTKEYTKDMKEFYKDLENGIKETGRSISDLQAKYKKDTAKDNQDYLRNQAEKSVGIGNDITGLNQQITDAQKEPLTREKYDEMVKLQDEINAKSKEQEEIKHNLVTLGFTEIQIATELKRAQGTDASKEFDDFKTKQAEKKAQYEQELQQLETQKKIYEYFENTKFDTTLGLQKALKDDKLFAMDEENRQLFIKLAEQQIALTQQKNEKIGLEQEIADATTALSTQVTTLQRQNVKLLKAEYQDLIRTIQQAVVAQQQLNATKSGKGFAEGGYTGNAPVDKVVGDVHGQEYVLSQPMLAKMPGIIPILESIRGGGNNSTDNSKKINIQALTVGDRNEANSILEALLWKL